MRILLLCLLLTGCVTLTPAQRATGKAVVAQVKPVAAAWWAHLLAMVPKAPLPLPTQTGLEK